MTRRSYLDFDLLIEREGTGYRSRVLDSPSGQASAEFSLPFSKLEIENFLLKISRTVGEARRGIRRLESPERQSAKTFGGSLFDTVFAGAVRQALQSSLNAAYNRRTGLRVRVRLTDAPELLDLPWEFLFNSSSSQFLCLSPDTPVVRYLDLPYAIRPLTVTPPLRVLVMISSPTDFPQLDVAAEWERLESALRPLIESGLVELERLPDATLSSLQRPLRSSQYHVFHFIGHGGFDEQAQDGALVLEDATRRGRLVSGQDLAVMLTGHHSLRLVILNACEGARSSTSDPFAGVAQTLLRQAIPATVAMQFEITDDAAITFAHEFYGAIADGYPVDAAVAEARRGIFASGNELEWATPVLYMRSPNGQLFRLTRDGAVIGRQREEDRASTDQGLGAPATAEPVEPVVAEPVEPVVPEPVDPVVPEPIEPVVEPVRSVVQEPIEPVVEPVRPVVPEPVEPVAELIEPVWAEPIEPVVAEPVEPVVAEPAEPVMAGQIGHGGKVRLDWMSVAALALGLIVIAATRGYWGPQDHDIAWDRRWILIFERCTPFKAGSSVRSYESMGFFLTIVGVGAIMAALFRRWLVLSLFAATAIIGTGLYALNKFQRQGLSSAHCNGQGKDPGGLGHFMRSIEWGPWLVFSAAFAILVLAVLAFRRERNRAAESSSVAGG